MNDMRDKLNKVNLDLRCPVCNQGNLYMIYKVTNIPYFGGIVTMTIRCDICSLKINDIMAVSEKGELPTKHERRTVKQNMGDLVILSAGSLIKIPEIGVEIHISRENGGEITTIEGILQDVREKVISLMRNSTSEDKIILEDILKKIDNELNTPSGGLHIVLIDENQKSAIISNELWTKQVEEERNKMMSLNEIKKLGREIITKYKDS